MEQKPGYSTTNFYFAAWLMVRGYEADVVYAENDTKRATFVFEGLSLEEADVFLQEYHQDDVTQEFISAIRRLKTQLYSDNPR